MIEKMIVDADLCIKLGGSDKYRFLYDVLPLVAKSLFRFSEHASCAVRFFARCSQNRRQYFVY